jgi:hypothetical protein
MAEQQTAPATKRITRLRLWNTTAGDIVFNLAQVPREPAEGKGHGMPALHVVKVPHHSLAATVVEGDDAQALSEQDIFEKMVAGGQITIDKEPTMGQQMRATSEPEPPADLKPATKVGTVVDSVGSMNVKVKQLDPTH